MANLYLLCGPLGAGKTTLAKKMQLIHGIAAFGIDEMMLQLYEDDTTEETYVEHAKRCKALLYDLSDILLHAGTSVVLDFGFWTKEERNAIRARYVRQGHEVTLVYVNFPEEERIARLKLRNEKAPFPSYVIAPTENRLYAVEFEEPTPDEEAVILDSEEKVVNYAATLRAVN